MVFIQSTVELSTERGPVGVSYEDVALRSEVLIETAQERDEGGRSTAFIRFGSADGVMAVSGKIECQQVDATIVEQQLFGELQSLQHMVL